MLDLVNGSVTKKRCRVCAVFPSMSGLYRRSRHSLMLTVPPMWELVCRLEVEGCG